MRHFRSIAFEGTRRIFLVFFTLSCLLPLLVVIFIVSQYLLPLIEADKSGLLGDALTYGLLVMFLFPLISFFQMSRWIASLEGFTRKIRIKSEELVNGEKSFLEQTIENGGETFARTADNASESGEENEIQSLVHSFNSIFQTAADQLAEREHLKSLLASLIALASDLTSELESSRLFPLIISRVTDVMSAERTSLYVIDWDKHELWTKVAEGIDPIVLPLGRGISGRVAETGEMINVPDAWELPYFDRSFDENNKFRTRSVICLPVKNPTGELIGVLQVINKKGNACFDHRDEIFLKGLASQVGIALENSLLIDEIRLSFNSSISTLSAIVDARHPLTAGHSQRVTEYSLQIAGELSVGKNDIEVLRFAALLHDIGKIGIRDGVLLKEGLFTPEERQEMSTHPAKTKQILDKFHFPKSLRTVPEIAGSHHEMVNGRGYPEGLTAEQIPFGAKIIAVADVFDALTSRREYPKYAGKDTLDQCPMPLSTAISLLRKDTGSHFEQKVVAAFIRCLPAMLERNRGNHFPTEYVDEGMDYLAVECRGKVERPIFQSGSK